jgi:hypothetical protein
MFVYGIPKFSHGEVMQSQLFFESKLQYKHRNPVRASIGINQKHICIAVPATIIVIEKDY